MKDAATLEEGRRLHREGRVEAALRAYRSILKRDPRNFDALCLCAMAQVQLGKPAEAARSIQRALDLRPDSADARNAQGNVMMALKRHERAVRCYESTLAIDPNFADGHLNLGNALTALGRHEDAARAYERAVALRPDWAEAHVSLGVALSRNGRLAEALRCFEMALSLRPGFVVALYNRGNTLKKLNRHEEAIASYREALSIEPDFAEAHTNIGTSLEVLHRHAEAIESYRKALAIRPGYAVALTNLSNALVDSGSPEEGIEGYRAALAIDPGSIEAGVNLSHTLLSIERFDEGWRAFERRIDDVEFLNHLRRTEGFATPRGSVARDIRGQRLLLQAEQGLGDEIMFASMVPDAVAAAEHVALVAEPRLTGLFRRSFPACRVTARVDGGKGAIIEEPAGVTRRFFLGSLGRLFRSRIEDFPGTSYLVADPVRRRQMRRRLDALGPGRKIGIMWRGGIGGPREGDRSLGLRDLAPLLAEGIHWISLNHLPTAAEEVSRFRDAAGMAIHHWPEIVASRDYDDTAALLGELDAVVSVTCTVAHCAAALGKETHVLVPPSPEWRYGRVGPSIPWYNSMRLYRRTDDWPLDAVARALGIA